MALAARRLEPVLYVVAFAVVASLLIVLGYATKPYVPLLALSGAIALAVVLASPIAGVMLAIALVPLELVSLPLGQGSGLTPSEAVFALSGIGWGVRRLARSEPFDAGPLPKPIGLLLLALVPGLAFAEFPGAILKTLVMWSCFGLAFLAIVEDGRVQTVRRLLVTLALAGVVVAVVALVSAPVGAEQPALTAQGTLATGRAVGPFAQPNTLGAFLALALPGALVLGLRGPVALRPWSLGAFVVIFAGLAASLSRGGLLAAIGALGFMLLWRPVRLLALIGVVIVAGLSVAGAASFGSSEQVDLVTKRLSSIEYSAQSDPRIELWQTIPQVIGEHPVFGVGWDQFQYVSPRYGLIDPLLNQAFPHAHDILLTFWVELGLPGLVAALWFIGALGMLVIRALRRRSGDERGLAFAAAAGLLALGLDGIVDFPLRANVIAALMLVLAACATALADPGGRTATSAPRGRDARAPAAA